MSKKLILLWLLVVCFSCSPDSQNEEVSEIEKTFDVNFITPKSQILVDVPFQIQVESNDPIYEINRITNNGSQGIVAAMPGTALEDQFLILNLQFATLGNQEAKFEFISTSGKKAYKTFNFEVVRGSAVKLIGFKINSFYNINGTWDAEYAENDTNRLADIIFSFQKLNTAHFSDPKQSLTHWYLSPVYPNQQQLEWNLSQKELYISDRSIFEIGIGDDDGDGIGDDLTRSFRGLNIRLNDYRDSKPSDINISSEEYGIDVSVQLEWL